MSDLKLATQDAVYAALGPLAGTLIDGEALQLFQHVPQDTQPPLVMVGDIVDQDQGAKGSVLELHTIEIVSEYRGPARKWLYAIMAAVRNALDDVALTVPAGSVLSRPVYTGSEDGLLEDGETYQGRQRFQLFAQPAD